MLAQTFGKPAGARRHGARTLLLGFSAGPGKTLLPGTNVSRKSVRWDWRLEANLNRKANGLALEEPFCGTLRTFVGI
jgi:hypothetical protein